MAESEKRPFSKNESFARETVSVSEMGCLSIIVLGASGDLAKKKTFPALFNLYQQDFLQLNDVHIFGYSRTQLSDDELRDRIRGYLPLGNDMSTNVLDFLQLARLAAAREKYGRDIRVFETSVASAAPANVSDMEETDDFYEFTAEDYYRLLGTKKEVKHLKTKKIRDAELAAQRSRMTKASFHPSESIQSLFDLLTKVVAHPDLSFYLYTTPPKKQIKDLSQDFYSAGFVPGAIVYFTYDVPKGDDGVPYTGPSLQEEVVSLQGLEFVAQQAPTPEPTPEAATTTPIPSVVPEQIEQKPSEKKKMVKPKWLKM